MHEHLKNFFDLLEYANSRLSILHHFLVNLALLGLLILGIRALLAKHPKNP